MEKLVSIIMPLYNCEKYIESTIISVISQNYTNFELLIVDDCSTDSSIKLINRFLIDKRIKLFKFNKNQGTAAARNFAIRKAKGTFISFLDSDDTWSYNKLSLQIQFMEKNNYYFTCTSYSLINSFNKELNHKITYKGIYNYNRLLFFPPGNSTVIYNSSKIGKIYIPNIKKRNDYLMWLTIVKKSPLYSLNILLTKYRLRNNSLSRNKFSLLKYHWLIYKKYEKIPFLKSISLIIFFILKTLTFRIMIITKL